MSLEVFRIDERLLHGQVVVGWGEKLGLDYYVVVDDQVATSEWEREMYRSGAPARARVEFLTVEEAVRRFPELEAIPGTGMLLTGDTGAMRRLAEAGLLEGRRVNVGCLSSSEGRVRVLDYVHLRPEEAEDLLRISEAGARVSARDLPDARRVPLESLVDDDARP